MLLGALRPCFTRTQTWVQAGKYLSALASELPSRNGWTIAEYCGDRSPDCTQRLLNRASWDEAAAMSQVRRHAVAGLDQAAARCRRARMTVGALDETGQEKAGTATAGVKRQYMGCAGRVANGINTVHLSYVRERTGHALIGARQWIPAGHIDDPVRSQAAGLPADLRFRTKGQLAVDVLTDAYADGLCLDFVAGTRFYGSCTELRQYLEQQGQAYVLRVASSFMLTFAGVRMTCADAVRKLLKDNKQWEVRSAGRGSKGERWYAWAWIATASARRSLLVRRHLGTGELAFHYCFVPEGQAASKARLITAAGLRWPVEEDHQLAKQVAGLDAGQVIRWKSWHRWTAICLLAYIYLAVAVALQRQADAGVDLDAGLIPVTVPELLRLLRDIVIRPPRRDRAHRLHWSAWRRRHQHRARQARQRWNTYADVLSGTEGCEGTAL